MDIEKYKFEKIKHEKTGRIFLFVIIAAFVLFIPVGVGIGIGGAILMQAVFLFSGIMLGVNQSKFKKLSLSFKNDYLREMIEKIYPNSTFIPEHGFSQEDVYNSLILRKTDRFYSEDYLSGTYNDIPFESADVKLQNVHHSGKSTTVVTVFLGRLYRFQFPRNFATEMIIVQPGFGVNFAYGNYEKIATESVEFNQEYKVYATGELEAFRLLLPQFMERLLDLDQQFKDKISFAFVRNILYVAVNNNVDTLELKMNKPIDEKIFEDFEIQLSAVKTITEIFANEEFHGYSHT
ncbi:MAG: DUF3137 domain-containing protein [Bacilli bacterium]|nr:DUF3137 domain-containing protein [Bacilli bacterium]MBN2697167.1 DUF3137 domain-containing protein [Bacilli bacterium]